ncbi:MAG: hypothetical protein NT013_24500 [Planctomycetia bacterium]|nr:hypothetical protein [Planctomycetia bacterium]
MSFAKQNKSEQAIVLYGLHKPFDPAVQIRRGNQPRHYLKWLDVKSAAGIPVELPKPTDYVAIYRIADVELSKLRQ